MKKKFICIVCPNGCEIEVRYSEGEIEKISGNLCERGLDYVKRELFSPERSITSSVEVRNGLLPLVSVKTSKPIPKERIFALMDEIANIEVEAPVRIGDVIVKDVLGTGADIIATKNVDKRVQS
ncbi:MAG: molybdopterin oxidoreductase [Candidatus Altiarchaeales archaeon ex4484_43]|nr:MAG: molybdopterin oxidoreductase [Candidatus Altiarchaeales archaeon ex4484_43]RLI89611.1 MAG: molybdopterin oxidoreductase [Candidatus Altiarchaeales archaeon]